MRSFVALLLTLSSPSLARAPKAKPAPTCPLASPLRSPAELEFREWLGQIGDRSWLLGERGGHLALAALDDRGELAVTELPPSGGLMSATAIDGTRLWLVTGAEGLQTGGQQLYAIDLGGAAPAVSAPRSLERNPLAGTDAFAIGSTRALLFTFAVRPTLQLWDLPQGAPLGASVQLDSSSLEPPALRCVQDRCFAVGVKGDGPTRRATVWRFDPADGSVEAETLSDDHLGSIVVLPRGDRTVVVWDSYSRAGLFARVLDAKGRGEPEVVPLHPAARSPVVVAGPEPRLAFKADRTWQIATLSAKLALGRVQPLELDSDGVLTGASTADGVLAAWFSTDVAYDGMFHTWSAKGSAVFLPHGLEPQPTIEVMPERIGDGMGGYAAFPLVTRDRAAVLTVPLNGDSDSELVRLRQPCP